MGQYKNTFNVKSILIFPIIFLGTLYSQNVPLVQCVTQTGPVLTVVPCLPAPSSTLPSNPSFVSITTTGPIPTPKAGTTTIYNDPKTFRLTTNPNATGPIIHVGVAALLIPGHLVMVAPNGIDLVDTGIVVTAALISKLKAVAAGSN